MSGRARVRKAAAAVAEAAVLVAAALALRWWLEPLFEGRLPYLTVYPVLLLVLWRRGLRVAVLAALAAAAAMELAWPPLARDAAAWQGAQGLRLLTYALACGGLLAGGALLRLQQARLRAAGEQAEALRRERLAQQQAVAKADARLAALVRHAHDAIVASSPDGRIETFNPAAERLFGYTEAEVLGQPVSILCPPRLLAQQRAALLDAARGQTVSIETVRLTRDGRELQMQLSLAPVFDAAGRLQAFGGLLVDIGERKAAEAQQREAAQRLREADRQKDQFLALLAHELRNPLAPLNNCVALLRRRGDAAEVRAQSVAVMERQLGHMVRLVNDLLDVGRITQGRLHLARQVQPLAPILEQALETSRPLIEGRGHALSVSLDPALVVDADATRLAQVFSNLLNNAAKYTPPGGAITLRSMAAGSGARVEVADNGIGLAPAQQAAVFELFTQFVPDQATNEGLGIGLGVARRLVELHGGTIAVHSDGPGLGACFSVELPAAELPPAVAPQAGELLHSGSAGSVQQAG